jgi:hypothetical protein
MTQPPQGHEYYRGTSTEELERLLRDPRLPRQQREAVSYEYERRIADSLLNQPPPRHGPPPPPPASPPPPRHGPQDHPGQQAPQAPRPRQPQPPPARQSPPAQPGNPARTGSRRKPLVIGLIVASGVMLTFGVILIIAVAMALDGGGSSSNAPTYATTCVTPAGTCQLTTAGTPVGTGCFCVSSDGSTVDGTAQ